MKIKFFLLLVAIFALGAVARIYQIYALTDWSGDSGGDLLIARNILYYGHRPMVGPFLTVENIFLPPLYFYILAGILWVVQSPMGIVYAFVVMNMLTGAVIGILAKNMIDRTAGVVALAVFAVSATFVEHGRSFYQPYMVEPFFVFFLYLLWKAIYGKHKWQLVFALISFSIAAAIYPSPWLLSPYILYLLYSYIISPRFSGGKARNSIRSVVLLCVGSIPIYIPWVVHEMQYGFPTIVAIFRGKSADMSNEFYLFLQYGTYLYQLANQFFGIDSLTTVPFSYYLVSFLIGIEILLVVMINKDIRSFPQARADLYGRAFSFVSIRWYLISFIPMVIFWENAYHRLWVYLPIHLLLFTLISRYAIESRNVWIKICVGIIGAIFIIGNISANWIRINTFPRNTLGNTEEAAIHILSDAHQEGIECKDYQILYYTRYGYGNYNLATIMYFIQQYGGCPVQFLKHGNDIERYRINTPHTNTVYLICRNDISLSEQLKRCNDYFLNNNPSYISNGAYSVKLGEIYKYKRKPI